MERRTEDMHLPVLRDLCVELLSPALREPGSVMIDATLGMGGHAEAVLSTLPNVTVIGIDRDPQALALASDRLITFEDRFIPVNTTYDRIDRVAAEYGRSGYVDAILMDLGVSSLQLDEAERGFSYAQEGPLDMRMNQLEGQSAQELLNTASAAELTRILREYGEERFASRIAATIVRRREEQPLSTTAELADLVRDSIPAPARRKGGNPAKRTFQALRVAVNDELRILERAVPGALDSLRVGGRLVIEAYQSLEDRIVKRILAEGLSDTAPVGLPVIPPGHEPRLRAVINGALKADENEIARNPRAKSVRLRAVEVVTPWRQS